ncbi:class I SAM-dependent methyltransferase [Ornithinimicrobium murale]|uniref:class I SAM-dependent methyltransferase n=1 Tax=Ornithinimicrobium murale TaxID=1050153 RepID=UPI000E0D40A7|nr:class I SAM-dependent methyltransferase [Ornithinimicrobium murale]
MAITTAAPATTELDHDKLMSFVFRVVGEVGASLNSALVVMGDQLGYYGALADHGPFNASQLARATDTDEHYAREWLNAQAAGDYLDYDPETELFSISPEHAAALTDPACPGYVQGLFQIAHGTVRDAPHILAAARTGEGYGWDEHNTDVHLGCERFFRPSYLAHLTAEWLPALDGVVARLERGGRVADIGCGHGATAVLLAQSFPHSSVVGTDYHAESIDVARQRAAEAGVADRASFQVASGAAHPGTGYDLVTMFDCLHDMGDPVGAARHVKEILAPDGTWMIVEPIAGDRPEENFNPVGRAYYAFSTLLCTPSSLAQDVGTALGTQAGPARIKDVTAAAGFTRFRTVASTPFNNVFEVRA